VSAARPTAALNSAALDDAAQDDAALDGAAWDTATDLLRSLPRQSAVLLTCHVNPDGDALGSMLGCALGLAALGFTRLQASFPGKLDLPESLDHLPGIELLVAEADLDPQPDLVMAFDVASIERIGDLADLLRAAPRSIVFDHHASNTRYGQVNLVDPSAAATSVVVDRMLSRLGVRLDARIAECLYVALVTDTGSFRFDSTTPGVHEFAARLIATGIRPGEISRQLFDNRPFGAVRLFGEALSRTQLEPSAAGGLGLAWTYATLDDLERYGQRPYVLESLIDSVRCVEEADVACVAKQVRPDEWAMSLRSRGRIDVSQVAVALGGGGHRLAAGFTGYGEVDDILAQLREQLSVGAVQR
jgi:phosphoesterase RecJ-like protein